MRYHFFTGSADLKVVGKFPQLEKMFDGFNMLRRYEAFGIVGEERTAPKEKLQGFRLKYHAKMTDLISAAQFGSDCKLMSDRLYDLIMGYKVMPHTAVPSEVVHRQKRQRYMFVYFPESYRHFVDFKKSRFFLYERSIHYKGSHYKGAISFENYEAYEEEQARIDKQNKGAYQTQKPTTYIEVSELFLDEQIVDLDFFCVPRFHPRNIVSDRLRKAVEVAGMTGIGFSPAQSFKRQVFDYSVFPPKAVE